MGTHRAAEAGTTSRAVGYGRGVPAVAVRYTARAVHGDLRFVEALS